MATVQREYKGEEIEHWQGPYSRPVPRFFMVDGNTTVDGSGNGVIRLGPPPAQIVWFFRKVVVTGPAPASSITGTAVIYRSSAVPGHVIDIAPSIPNVGDWGDDQVPIMPGEYVVVVLAGCPINTQVFATITVEQELLAKIKESMHLLDRPESFGVGVGVEARVKLPDHPEE